MRMNDVKIGDKVFRIDRSSEMPYEWKWVPVMVDVDIYNEIQAHPENFRFDNTYKSSLPAIYTADDMLAFADFWCSEWMDNYWGEADMGSLRKYLSSK